jgi:transcriptional regulator with XRE-family HTH domain
MSTKNKRGASPASWTPADVGRQIRRLRTKLGISLRAFAERTGFSPSFISQIEKGAVSPSLGSLEKIAEALGVSLRDFFAPPEDGDVVVRHDERQQVSSSWSRASIEALGVTGQKLQAMMIVLEPGGRSGKHGRAQPKEEFAIVADGEVQLTLGDAEHKMRKGDSVIVPAAAVRLWVNASRKEARVIVVSAL